MTPGVDWYGMGILRAREISLDRALVLAFLAAVAIAALIAPSAALGASVKVDEVPASDVSSNYAHLFFVAGPDEQNHVTFTVTGEDSAYFRLEVVDTGASISPGPKCTGGGAIGAAVTCMLHRPLAAKTVSEGKMLVAVPATAWVTDFSIDLGQGKNFFDARGFVGEYSDRVDMTVTGGSGSDTIFTGNGEDTIDPGYGSDEIHTAGGYDRVTTTPSADGPDLYDLGRGEGRVSYEGRTEPVVVNGTELGAVGEGDQLLAQIPWVDGGSGDDNFVGGPDFDRFEGNGGEDTLSGEGGNDELVGGAGDDHLVGGAGGDTLVGGPGNDVSEGGAQGDRIVDLAIQQDGGFTTEPFPVPPGTSGEDVALGGSGPDTIELYEGDDHAQGGQGNDRINGGAGSDDLFGNAGRDSLVGGADHDRMWGGVGRDTLFGGRTPRSGPDSYLLDPSKDDGPDLAGCGPGSDVAVINPWDTGRGCETIHFVRPKRTSS